MMEKEKVARPSSTFESYEKTVGASILNFTIENQIVHKITNGEFRVPHYHGLLLSIFHQVYFSSTSFALAGAMASNISTPVRSYLIHHAEEEKDHWMWILEDLKSTGYSGPDPRSTFPNWASQAYLSYGTYLSFFNPIGRLAMANVLEGISGQFGTKHGLAGLKSLGLQKEQAKFFLSHGELDQGHTMDIIEVLKNEKMSGEQWAELEHVARTTSQLYKNIYNLAISDKP
jgi:hypothetical protein